MIIIRGIDKFVGAINAKNAVMRAETRRAVVEVMALLERETRNALRKKTHARGTDTPSEPGEPPALVSGQLMRSIASTGPEPIGRNGWRGQVGPTAIYGRIQELGGNAGRGGATVLPARPYLAPTLEEFKPQIDAIFVEHWRRAILS